MEERKYERGEKKEAILEAADKLFFLQTFDKTTVQQIADACDTSKGLVTYHFPQKADIYSEINSRKMNIIQTIIDRQLETKYGKDYELLFRLIIRLRLMLRIYRDYKTVYENMKQLSTITISSVKYTLTNGLDEVIRKAFMGITALSDNEINFISLSLKGSIITTCIAFFNGELDMTYLEYEDKYIETTLNNCRLPEGKISHYLTTSMELMDEFNLESQVAPLYEQY